MEHYISGIFVLLLLWLAVGAWRLRRKRVSLGPGAAGMMHEMLNDERRAAVQIIAEERTSYRDPEDRAGNLPDLEAPTIRSQSSS